MKAVRHPQQNVLTATGWQQLRRRHEELSTLLEHMPNEPDHCQVMKVQNEVMVLRLALEQRGGGQALGLGPLTRLVVERDLGGLDELLRTLSRMANTPQASFVVMALSYADFRFHLYPVNFKIGMLPFCASPIACWPVIPSDDAEAPNPTDQSQTLPADTNWQVIESRMRCLQEPLDLFHHGGDGCSLSE
jgi:hypothetical protein